MVGVLFFQSPATSEISTLSLLTPLRIYQVYPRGFAAADGEGYGNLPAVRSRLPYLRDLGVDAVWLSPFYPSPQADAGYDVADYRDVDLRFRSEERRVGKECRSRWSPYH